MKTDNIKKEIIKVNIKRFLLVVLILYCSVILYHKVLTLCFSHKFKDFHSIGVDEYMHAYDEDNVRICVLSYGPKHATVYFFSKEGGEEMRFERKGDVWSFERCNAIWVDKGGNAADYFVGPYFKHYVP